MSWYRTGTVAVTNGSKTVTGVGTLWTTAVNAGDAFALVDANLNPTGAWYEVDSVTNNTTLVLKQSYAGTTASNKTYCVFNLVGNMTTPSFAQRLAQFFDSFQGLIDKPTTTPTASSIPIADSGGKIADGWIPATVARLASPTFTGTPTAPTQTASDNSTKIATTAHVLRKLQSVGLGGTTAGEMVHVDATDWDTITTPGLYSIMAGSNLNAPVEAGAGFTLLVSGYKSSSTMLTTQLAIRVGAEEMFVRRKPSASAEWTPWRRVYEQGSILGTVSQSGGVPTGAVIERGSNANGEYVKFADGTMICTKTITDPGTPSQMTYITDLYRYTIGWTLPATFSGTYFVGGCGADQNNSVLSFSRGTNTSTSVGMQVYSKSTTMTSVLLSFVAIGRWF